MTFATSIAAPALAMVGRNPTRLWGLTTAERTRRLARARGRDFADDADDSATLSGDAPVVLVNAGFVVDPTWLDQIAARPGAVLTLERVPVLAHCRDAGERRAIAAAMHDGRAATDTAMTELAAETESNLANPQLRKRERAFVLPLRPDTVRSAERASYFGAYKGVTDLLTKYLWPEWALALTRLAARLGISPNMVTSLGAALCLAATIAFWHGHYWSGMAMGLGFMVLDTVDGKLARCTITSSSWGNVFDHGIDLVHPPFWWWAWGVGLAVYGRPLSNTVLAATLIAIVGGYVLQRLIEGLFIKRFGMEIHVWRRFDSAFRLVTARRNPNMVILFVAMLLMRPDAGLIAVAVWTVISLLVHAVRLWQAYAAAARSSAPLTSWLESA